MWSINDHFMREEKMGNAIIKKDILLDLSVGNAGFEFSTSIADAMTKAEAELVV